jgi:ATP-dependent DNA helicase RecG
MPTKAEIEELLVELDTHCADDLETHELDFKEWNVKSYKDSGELILETAICLANARGGSIVIGVNDKVVGRIKGYFRSSSES